MYCDIWWLKEKVTYIEIYEYGITAGNSIGSSINMNLRHMSKD